MFDPTTRRITVSRYVVFDEDKGWKWDKNSNNEDDEPGRFSIEIGVFGNQGIRDEEIQEIIDSPADEEQSSLEENETLIELPQNINEQETLRRSSIESKRPNYLDDYVYLAEKEGERLLLLLNEEPWDFEEAMELKVWRDACEEEIASIVKNKTWDLADLPKGAKAIGLKWIFKIKRNSDGSINKYKSRLVAKGYIQRHGVDFEEVFAPVARIETVRFIIALAASRGWRIHHLDVKTAFLHGDLKETVFLSQPEGFKVKGSEDKVYKLNKALYGLRQAPRAWNEKLNKVLEKLQFVVAPRSHPCIERR